MRYLVMELVQGMDLHSYVQNHGPMRVPDAIHCIIEAARGLEYAHQQGVIHRDIKPANLLLATAAAVSVAKVAANIAGTKSDPALAETKLAPDVAKSRIKVLDMGLARIDEPAVSEVAAGRAKPENAPLTNAGDVMGTVDYMSPEQASDTHTVDARTDIYALGCTLCYLLTGHAPYYGDTLVKRLMAHRNDSIPSLTGERPDVPKSLDALFQTMLTKHPDDRTQTMTAVIATLEDCRLEVSSEAQKAAIIRTPTSASADHSTSPGKAIAGATVFVVHPTDKDKDVSTETNAEGNFTFAQIAASDSGTQFLVWKDGYAAGFHRLKQQRRSFQLEWGARQVTKFASNFDNPC